MDRGFCIGSVVAEKPEDIAWHTEAIAGHYERDQPLVLIRNSSDSSVANATQIFIHARSHAQLFSRVCAELEQLELSARVLHLLPPESRLETKFGATEHRARRAARRRE